MILIKNQEAGDEVDFGDDKKDGADSSNPIASTPGAPDSSQPATVPEADEGEDVEHLLLAL